MFLTAVKRFMGNGPAPAACQKIDFSIFFEPDAQSVQAEQNAFKSVIEKMAALGSKGG
jgi:hypothetical protein